MKLSEYNYIYKGVPCRYIPCEMSSIFFNLSVKAGSLNDGNCFGLAHYVEHMLLASINSDSYEKTLVKGTTMFDYTKFDIALNYSFKNFKKGIGYINHIINGDLNKNDLELVREEILDEFYILVNKKDYSYEKRIIHLADIAEELPIGKIECINSICYDDIVEFYKNYYTRNRLAVNVLGGNKSWFSDILETAVVPA